MTVKSSQILTVLVEFLQCVDYRVIARDKSLPYQLTDKLGSTLEERLEVGIVKCTVFCGGVPDIGIPGVEWVFASKPPNLQQLIQLN